MKAILNTLLITLSSLVVAQGIENNGAYIGTSDGVYLGTTDLTNDAAGTVALGEGQYDLSGDLTNGGAFTLDGFLSVSGTLNNTGSFSIASGASLIDGGSTSGSFTVNKSILGNGPKYLSSPITTGVVGSFTGGFVYEYDEETSTWNALTSETASLSVMGGYSVEFLAAKDISFVGSLNTAGLSKALTNAGDGWNLVGNPYPSAVDWDDASWTKTGIGNAYYVWNSTDGNYTTYLGSTSGLGVVVNPETGADAGILAKLQAFFVKASDASPSIGVTNDARVHSSKEIIGNAARETEIGNAFVKLKLVGENERGDEIVVRIHEEASESFDPQFDAFKLYSFDMGVPQIASKNAELEDMAINSLAPVNEYSVPLLMRAGAPGDFTIEAIELENEGYDIYLIDHKEEASFDLRAGEYSFAYELGETDRFELLFASDAITGVDEIPLRELKVENLYSGISIQNNDGHKNLTIELYDINGKLISRDLLTINSGQVERYVPAQVSSVYLYRIYYEKKTLAGKMIVR